MNEIKNESLTDNIILKNSNKEKSTHFYPIISVKRTYPNKNSFETRNSLIKINSVVSLNASPKITNNDTSFTKIENKNLSHNESINKEDAKNGQPLILLSSSDQAFEADYEFTKINTSINKGIVRTYTKFDSGCSSLKKLINFEPPSYYEDNELVKKLNFNTVRVERSYYSSNKLRKPINLLESNDEIFNQSEDKVKFISKKISTFSDIYPKHAIMKKLTSSLHKNVDDESLHYFLMNPLPKEKTLMCKIIKTSENLYGKLFPKYCLYINSNEKFLLSAKKVFKATSTTYYISLDQNVINPLAPSYLSKVSSNFIGNEFNIFDKGKDPKETKIPQEYRVHYASVIYDINIVGMNGPRKMRVYLPELNNLTDEYKAHKPKNSKEYLQNIYKKNIGIKLLVNKAPEWDDIFKTYSLKFNGRVQQASAKNFQLIEEKGEEIILQFGKINDSVYAMDVQYPLSPFLAFAICLSSLASKIACE